jgi:hypothetical protein
MWPGDCEAGCGTLIQSSRAAAGTDGAGTGGAGTGGIAGDGTAADIGARPAALEDEVAILEARLIGLEAQLTHNQAVHQDRLLEAVARLIDARLGRR